MTGHNGSNGSTMSSRIEKYGQWMGTIAENISFGEDNGKEIIM